MAAIELDGGGIVQLVVGLVLLAGAVLAFRHRGAVAEEMASVNRMQYDRCVSLLNRDRAERLAEAHATGPVDRGLVIFACAMAALVGFSLVLTALAG